MSSTAKARSTEKEPDSTDGESSGPVVRPFADWLREQGRGRSHDELSDALHELIAKVVETGKKGSLTYTVVVERMKGEAPVFAVSDRIQLKKPEHDRPGQIAFVDRHGNLTRSDPNQLEIENLRVVDTTTGELRDLDR